MTRRHSFRLLAAGTAAAGSLRAADEAPAAAATAMLTRAIPSSGEKLPVIGMGTWQTFDVRPKEAAPLELICRLSSNSAARCWILRRCMGSPRRSPAGVIGN